MWCFVVEAPLGAVGQTERVATTVADTLDGRSYFPFFPHRAADAALATFVRSSGVIFSMRALAPRLPSCTAAAFFRFAIYLDAKRSALGIQGHVDMLSAEDVC